MEFLWSLFCLLLGGASGIGRATVERLSQEGAVVAVFDINREAGEKLAGDSNIVDKLMID